ncbi:MAG: hypothetical protein Q8R60_07015 [Mycobacteriales bacterium]|nr:hypothetical protein [Mycobacteriales bacterium]
MSWLTVLYVLFVAGALAGAGWPCRIAFSSWRSGRATPDAVTPARPRRPKVRR